jgi:Uma2 family endonuclease
VATDDTVIEMATDPKHRYSMDQYLALERDSEVKYEYWNGEVYAMSGGSLAHDQIMGNVDRAVARQLEGRPCFVFTNNMQIKVPAAPPYRYADGSVVCGNVEVEEFNGNELLVNPLVIWEVLSPSTEAFDRGDKFTYYKSIASFKEYIVIAQHRPHVTHFVRQDNGQWDYDELNEINGNIHLPTIDCVLTLSEIYKNVNLS